MAIGHDDIAHSSSPRFGRGLLLCAVAALLTAATACSSPNPANIELRKENQKLRDRVTELERVNAGRTAPVVPTTSPTIDPAAQVYGHLFTVHGIHLLSTAVDRDLMYSKPPVEGLKIHIQPIDQDGDVIKASGTFTVDAFDLQLPGGASQRIGHWEFPLSDAAKNWYGSRLIYSYVLKCPWSQSKDGAGVVRPAHSPVTVRITYVDELTRRQFSAQGTVNIPDVKP